MDSISQPISAPVENKLHFLDYWRIIRIRKALIITVFLITAIIATAVTFILPESYASTARIKVEFMTEFYLCAEPEKLWVKKYRA